MCACICNGCICVWYYTWICRQAEKKLRLGKLKSKFFKDFSQKSAYMYMSAHTLQGPVPTVDLRTPEENATTQHNVYTLATERYHFEPYLWCIDRCYGTPKTNIIVVDFKLLY